MSNFKYKWSQILSLITQCKKEGLITSEEGKIMKEFIVNKEPDLSSELQEYENDKDLRKLVDTLKVLSEITQMSSPVDNNLIDRKRRKQKSRKTEKPKKPEKEDQIDLMNCDIGNSPQLMFSKKIKRTMDDSL
jgi:predicted house-cleaning noncanonical NTP pyrophosphatase (MazG superfamily)